MDKNNKTQNSYNTLAWFYNKHWTTAAPELFDIAYERLLYPYLPLGGEVLDLCCGTGQLANILSERGYTVTGLDLSEELLGYARVNAPDAVFVHGDATDFSFNTRFDVVVSAFDSVNHLLTEADLVGAFKSTYNVLKSGSRFLFDVNGLDSFDDEWTAGFSIVEDDNVCIVKPDFDSTTNLCEYDITIFKKSGKSWARKNILVQEKYYTVPEIMDSLEKSGFHSLQVIDGEGDLGISGFRGRIFFIGIK